MTNDQLAATDRLLADIDARKADAGFIVSCVMFVSVVLVALMSSL